VTPVPWTHHVPTVVGALVSVREVECSDAAALYELLADPAVSAHVSAPPPSMLAFAGFIRWAIQQRQRGESICFGIVPHGLHSAIGIVQVRALEPSFSTAEWGFAIGAPFWGTGAFIDAANLVARFAFEQMGVHRLEARAVVENGRGNGALKKLGAAPEGQLARGFKRRNGYDDQFLWSVNASEYQQPALVPEPFSADRATRQIRDAIAAVQQTMTVNRRTRLLEPPPLYPFFVAGDRQK